MTETSTTTFSVPEISCDHCKATIEAAVAELPEIRSVDVDVATRTAVVAGGDRQAIVDAIEGVGFDVESS